MTTKTFPIPATCSKCGHQADIYVADESVFKAIEAYRKSRFAALWAPLMVQRIFVLLSFVFMIGVLAGRFLK